MGAARANLEFTEVDLFDDFNDLKIAPRFTPSGSQRIFCSKKKSYGSRHFDECRCFIDRTGVRGRLAQACLPA
jgi:hypothetical protein